MKKIAVITATRAEYGLLMPLLKEMMQDPEISPSLVVSGTHLLQKFGETVKFIENDNIPIACRLPIYDENFSGSEPEIAKAIALATELLTAHLQENHYDAVVVLGDRYELLGFCSACVICRVPIIHIHGGEITEGAIDDKIRHAVTKLASLHFPSVPAYAKRIVQMGEHPDFVHAVGALGIDNVMKLPLLSREELFRQIEIDTNLPVATVTFHPVTTESPEMALQEINVLLDVLENCGVYSVITMPNSDTGGDFIYQRIAEETSRHPEIMCLRKSLGQVRYLSLLKYADLMIGNSSSGILESASFSIPVVNIGDRQKGRLAPENVIHCDCTKKAIQTAIEKALSPEFRQSLQGLVNPYGDGHTAERMTAIIKETDFHNLVRKKFFDFEEI